MMHIFTIDLFLGEVSARNSTEIAYIYVVIDTNVFLDLDELKTIQSLIDWYPLPGKMFQRAIVVIPWVVLQVGCFF